MGQYKNGRKHGNGTYYYASGQKYSGDWVNDQKTGKGVFTWPDGNRYENDYSRISALNLVYWTM